MKLHTSEFTGSLKECQVKIKDFIFLTKISEYFCLSQVKSNRSCYIPSYMSSKMRVFFFYHVKRNRGCYVPSYMGSKMRIIIAPGGGRLATDATNVGFLPSMHLWRLLIGSFLTQLVSVTDYLQMISQIVAPGEALMTMLTLVVPVVRYIIVCTCTHVKNIWWTASYRSISQ